MGYLRSVLASVLHGLHINESILAPPGRIAKDILFGGILACKLRSLKRPTGALHNFDQGLRKGWPSGSSSEDLRRDAEGVGGAGGGWVLEPLELGPRLEMQTIPLLLCLRR